MSTNQKKFDLAMSVIAVMGIEAQMTTQFKNSVEMLAKQLMEVFGNLELVGDSANEFKAGIEQILVRGKADMPKMTAAIGEVYASHFSAEELEGMLAFYSSPVGQSMKAKAPILMAEGSAIGEKFGLSLLDDAKKLLPN